MSARCAAFLVLMAAACGQASPELPPSFEAVTADPSLIEGLELLDLWQVQHPEYAEPLKVLVSRKTYKGYADYRIAFYRLEGETYTRIPMPMTIGGYDRPSLGVNPALQLPAVVAKITDFDELMYVFVADGSVQGSSSDEDGWFDGEEHPLIEARESIRHLGKD